MLVTKLGFLDSEIAWTERSPGGRATAFLTSSRFDNIGHVERQEWLWAELAKHLSEEELAKVAMVFTMSEREHRWATEDSG